MVLSLIHILLSSEIATTLGGRYMIHEVYPYSLTEYLKASGIDVKAKNALYAHGKAVSYTHLAEK